MTSTPVRHHVRVTLGPVSGNFVCFFFYVRSFLRSPCLWFAFFFRIFPLPGTSIDPCAPCSTLQRRRWPVGYFFPTVRFFPPNANCWRPQIGAVNINERLGRLAQKCSTYQQGQWVSEKGRANKKKAHLQSTTDSNGVLDRWFPTVNDAFSAPPVHPRNGLNDESRIRKRTLWNGPRWEWTAANKWHKRCQRWCGRACFDQWIHSRLGMKRGLAAPALVAASVSTFICKRPRDEDEELCKSSVQLVSKDFYKQLDRIMESQRTFHSRGVFLARRLWRIVNLLDFPMRTQRTLLVGMHCWQYNCLLLRIN